MFSRAAATTESAAAMTTPGEDPQKLPTPPPGNYGEIAPGVPRYGQYAPAGWEPPQDVKDAQASYGSATSLPGAPAYPGFQGSNVFGATMASAAADRQSLLVPPGRVSLAIRLLRGAGLLQLLALVMWAFSMTTPAGQEFIRSTVAQSLAINPQAAAEVSAQSLFIFVAVLVAFIQAASAAGYFWLAAKLYRGRNWARTTALILTIVSVAIIPEGGSFFYLSVARIVLGIVAMVMLYRTPAKEFFLAHKAKRGSAKR